jgi:hypothetical protein
MGAAWRLWWLSELIWRGIMMAFCRFPRMSVVDCRSLRSYSFARMQHFVRRTTYVPFRRLLEDVWRKFTQRLFAALHGTLGSYLATLCRRAVLMLRHAFLFLGLSILPHFFFLRAGLRWFLFYYNANLLYSLSL